MMHIDDDEDEWKFEDDGGGGCGGKFWTKVKCAPDHYLFLTAHIKYLNAS